MPTPAMKFQEESVAVEALPVWQKISDHIHECSQCRFAIANQHRSLANAGCPACKALIANSASEDSPLQTLHFSSKMIELDLLGRLNAFETRLFDIHKACCSTCAAKLHNERLFFHALRNALSRLGPLDRNKAGATFKQVSAA